MSQRYRNHARRRHEAQDAGLAALELRAEMDRMFSSDIDRALANAMDPKERWRIEGEETATHAFNEADARKRLAKLKGLDVLPETVKVIPLVKTPKGT